MAIWLEAIAAGVVLMGESALERQKASPSVTGEREAPVIVVDLDGTLVLADTLDESLAGIVKERPYLLFLLPLWLLRGKAYCKQQVARHFVPDPLYYPYQEEVVDFLEQQRDLGREIILATAADERIAHDVARHTNFFTGVIASNGEINRAGAEKLAAIRERIGERKFTYIGNSCADIPVWREAEQVMVVARGERLLRKIARAGLRPDRIFELPGLRLAQLGMLLRPHQWSKNFLVFISLVLAHLVLKAPLLRAASMAFVAFSLCASCSYIINDICDLEADRQHPKKRKRLLASAQFSLRHALLLAMLLLVGSVGIALSINSHFTLLLLGYFVATLNYSLWIKRIALVDVVALSLLYTVRIIAGSAAIRIKTTPWLMGFSIFIFLSLALAKRYSELHRIQQAADKGIRVAGRGYLTEDIEQLAIFGGASGYLSVLVLALYLNSPEVSRLYGDIQFMWLLCPILIYWISRIWLLARRGILDEDPVVFTLHDRVSYLIGFLICLLLIMAL